MINGPFIFERDQFVECAVGFIVKARLRLSGMLNYEGMLVQSEKIMGLIRKCQEV